MTRTTCRKTTTGFFFNCEVCCGDDFVASSSCKDLNTAASFSAKFAAAEGGDMDPMVHVAQTTALSIFLRGWEFEVCLLQKLQADPRWRSWANFWGFLNGWQMGWTEQRNKSRIFKARCENLHLLQTWAKDQGPKRTKKLDLWSGLW